MQARQSQAHQGHASRQQLITTANTAGAAAVKYTRQCRHHNELQCNPKAPPAHHCITSTARTTSQRHHATASSQDIPLASGANVILPCAPSLCPGSQPLQHQLQGSSLQLHNNRNTKSSVQTCTISVSPCPVQTYLLQHIKHGGGPLLPEVPSHVGQRGRYRCERVCMTKDSSCLEPHCRSCLRLPDKSGWPTG